MQTNLTNYPTKIAFIGNYQPRKCGIATFTTDLHKAVADAHPESDSFVVAMNDPGAEYDYPAQVRFAIRQNSLADYKSAAEFLNLTDPSLVCLQHEYGIFGGQAGSHILALLEEITIPVVTTLHTVLQDPDREQNRVIRRLSRLSSRLVVMSQRGADFLTGVYSVPPQKIDIIPHGIPDVPFTDPNFYKDKLHVEGKHVMLTFGLLSPNKGIEYVIRALPEILTHVPDLVYVILGATHPHVKRQEGERYRRSLEKLAEDLGIDENVHFHDRFVALEELVEYIGAADIYVTPYLNQAQVVSGTLAYTVGAGKAVISTPYWYAEELLAQGRGVMVPFKDSVAIAEQAVHLLRDKVAMHAMRKRAYIYGREMTWPQVAQAYLKSFACAQLDHRGTRFVEGFTVHAGTPSLASPEPFPELRLEHLMRMTDDVGLFQHAIFHLPNYAEGYTTDDNARALLFAALLRAQGYRNEQQVDELLSRYLTFLWYAYNPATNRFRNFLGYDRRWLEETGSDDSHGRALWALGTVLGRVYLSNYSEIAFRMFEPGLPAVLDTTSPRAWAFTLLGIHPYLQRFPNDRTVRDTGTALAERLAALYRECSSFSWPWFEETVSYSNAHLSLALLLSSQWTGWDDHSRIGFKALKWLAELQTSPEGHFTPVGSNGFYRRGEQKARFDQQPLEAGAMVSACLEAYRISKNGLWLAEAQRAFSWYTGANDLGIPLYDPCTGGCYDGLHPDRINRNQGAESTLSFLMALVEMSSAGMADQDRTILKLAEASRWSSSDASFALLLPKPASSGNGRMRPEK